MREFLLPHKKYIYIYIFGSPKQGPPTWPSQQPISPSSLRPLVRAISPFFVSFSREGHHRRSLLGLLFQSLSPLPRASFSLSLLDIRPPVIKAIDSSKVCTRQRKLVRGHRPSWRQFCATQGAAVGRGGGPWTSLRGTTYLWPLSLLFLGSKEFILISSSK